MRGGSAAGPSATGALGGEKDAVAFTGGAVRVAVGRAGVAFAGLVAALVRGRILVL